MGQLIKVKCVKHPKENLLVADFDVENDGTMVISIYSCSECLVEEYSRGGHKAIDILEEMRV